MSRMPPLELLIAGYVVLGVVAMTFFWRSRDVRLKRRLWPVFSISATLMFAMIAWVASEGVLPWFFVPILVLVTAVNLRSVRFCNGCGRTVQRRYGPFAPAKHCPACGHELALGASSNAPPR